MRGIRQRDQSMAIIMTVLPWDWGKSVPLWQCETMIIWAVEGVYSLVQPWAPWIRHKYYMRRLFFWMSESKWYFSWNSWCVMWVPRHLVAGEMCAHVMIVHLSCGGTYFIVIGHWLGVLWCRCSQLPRFMLPQNKMCSSMFSSGGAGYRQQGLSLGLLRPWNVVVMLQFCSAGDTFLEKNTTGFGFGFLSNLCESTAPMLKHPLLLCRAWMDLSASLSGDQYDGFFEGFEQLVSYVHQL